MSTTRGSRLYRDQGIVLRSIRLGEADRIVTIFTQGHGRVRAVAKGARKTKSRFGGRLDAFTHVDVLLYRGRDLDIVDQAEILARFPRLRGEYPAFTAAAAMADAVDRTTPEQERNVRLFVLFRGGLRALEDGARDPSLLAHAFLAKVTSLAGLEPTLNCCVGCGSAERAAFSHNAGGAVCRGCTQRLDVGTDASVLDGWAQVVEADWETLRRMQVPPDVGSALGKLVIEFVQWQLDNRFRAFRLLATT